MANKEQVKRLENSVKQWNTWRANNPTIDLDLTFADLSNADLSEANLERANLEGANLYKADLSFANLIVADLYEADLSFANLVAAELSGANLRRANLRAANLGGATLDGAILSEAMLKGANLNEANLNEANLSGAMLKGASFSEAILNGANFTNAEMWGTYLGDHDLRVVEGLETIRHGGPSILGINSIYLSQGNIPEAFIRGAGVSNEILEYMKTLTNKSFEYYSCFISYSHHDETFAKRLHDDLIENNVQCWFAPHDIRIGDEFRNRIEESIRKHDKVLLVLSRHSINSTWVQKEVETAFEKEQKRKRPVLFPIKLDESVIRTRKSWAADIRRMRQIGDFQRWKDHDEYEQAFTRLLRDLKAESNI